MKWLEEHVSKLLIVNPSMNDPVPYLKDKTYKESVEAWEGVKVVLARKIAKDMNLCFDVNGDEFSMAVWHVVNRQIATTNWVRPCGVFPIWKAIYKKASLKVQQDLKMQQPTQNIQTILSNSLVKGMVSE